MIRSILIGVLAVGVAATAFWGYKEHQEKNAVLLQAENTYQRSFHELSYRMDVLHDKLGTAIAMNSDASLSPQMTDIWRVSSEALSNVGQLPLTLLPFNKTEGFLTDVGNFTYQTAVRNLSKEPLNKDETANLKKLYRQSGYIKNELRDVQHAVLDHNLRWMDVQLALSTQDEKADNTIIDGLKTIENTASNYSNEENTSPFMQTSNEKGSYQHVSGETITKAKALEIGSKIFNMPKQDIKIAKNGKGAALPSYSLSYQKGQKRGYMEMSQKGGHLMSLLTSRPMTKKKLSLHEGGEKAEAFLKKNKMDDMKLYQSQEYDHTGVYSFVYEQNGVKIYPDSVNVKVGLDRGDVTGLTADQYFEKHVKRDLPKATISIEEAKKKVNPALKIQEDSMAIIENDLNEEVLVYEFLGLMDNNTYRIYINALDGNEEKVEKLSDVSVNNFS